MGICLEKSLNNSGIQSRKKSDPSKLHLHNFGYWWLNLSFLLLEDALATFGNGFPYCFTNMGLKTPTCAHGTFRGILHPPMGVWQPRHPTPPFFTLHATPLGVRSRPPPPISSRNGGRKAQTSTKWPTWSKAKSHEPTSEPVDGDRNAD